MTSLRLLALATAALVATGCSSSKNDITGLNTGTLSSTGTLVVTAARPTLTFQNTSTSTIRFRAVNADILPNALFAACDTTCTPVAPGATITQPYSAMVGYATTATQVHVMFWRFSAAGVRDESSFGGTTVRLD